MPEEEAFAVLVKIMQDYRMRDMFKPSMAELGLCMYQLENLVAEYLPDLNQHFQSQNFHTSMYASSWFLTLFTTALSLPLACRIMDVFLSEGMEIIFKVALAMLTLGKDELMSLDMEGMLKVSKMKNLFVCQVFDFCCNICLLLRISLSDTLLKNMISHLKWRLLNI